MSRQLYFRRGTQIVRLVLDADFEETPLYADLIDAQTGEITRDNRLIGQILSGGAESLCASDIEALRRP